MDMQRTESDTSRPREIHIPCTNVAEVLRCDAMKEEKKREKMMPESLRSSVPLTRSHCRTGGLKLNR